MVNLCHAEWIKAELPSLFRDETIFSHFGCLAEMWREAKR